jgi:hypothetical protein
MDEDATLGVVVDAHDGGRSADTQSSREKVPAFSYDSPGTLERGTQCHFWR